MLNTIIQKIIGLCDITDGTPTDEALRSAYVYIANLKSDRREAYVKLQSMSAEMESLLSHISENDRDECGDFYSADIPAYAVREAKRIIGLPIDEDDGSEDDE